MKRIPELDGLRGVASVAIVLFHLWFVQASWLGTAVDLFFVLSGYLITAIILKNLNAPGFLVNFSMRRGLRIWPIYYLSLFGLLAFRRWLPDPGTVEDLPYYLTYTQGLTELWAGREPHFIYAFRHTWTLAIEEQFYLLWPALLLLVGRRGLVPLSVSMILIALASRLGGISPWLLLTRCDGFAFGGLLAGLLIDSQVEGRGYRILTCLGLSLLGFVLLSLPRMGATGLPFLVDPAVKPLWINLAYVGIVGAVVQSSGSPFLAVFRHSWLVWLGQVSYGLYLYHHILFEIVDGAMAARGLEKNFAVDLLKLAGSLAMAAGSWTLIERPILAFKDRFAYDRTPQASLPIVSAPGTIV